ncbi:N-acetyltransferase 6 [Nymphon striatum]|nr:N-acetyltransferase 6 [Nymphon striatum]
MSDEEDKLQIVPLHENWNLIEECCELLSSEWKRSRTARCSCGDRGQMEKEVECVCCQEQNKVKKKSRDKLQNSLDSTQLQSLEKSCFELPTSLVLLKKNENSANVILAHSRICKILDDPCGCWIESGKYANICLAGELYLCSIEAPSIYAYNTSPRYFVVAVQSRGLGFGREIMKRSENYARSLGFTIMYLSTHDKESFYDHLGYEKSRSVCSLRREGFTSNRGIGTLINIDLLLLEKFRASFHLDQHQDLITMNYQNPP